LINKQFTNTKSPKTHPEKQNADRSHMYKHQMAIKSGLKKN